MKGSVSRAKRRAKERPHRSDDRRNQEDFTPKSGLVIHQGDPAQWNEQKAQFRHAFNDRVDQSPFLLGGVLVNIDDLLIGLAETSRFELELGVTPD
jgi:hypothetical protein